MTSFDCESDLIWLWKRFVTLWLTEMLLNCALLEVSEKEEVAVALHLPIGLLKTCSLTHCFVHFFFLFLGGNSHANYIHLHCCCNVVLQDWVLLPHQQQVYKQQFLRQLFLWHPVFPQRQMFQVFQQQVCVHNVVNQK